MNRGMNNVWSLVLASACVYGVLAVLMGVIPGIALSRDPATPGLQPYTAAEKRGRDVYVAEGCAYCHSQVVRPLAQDKPFGRPSIAGDYAFDTPELLGDHRNGPDLTNVGNRQPSAIWNYIHLWDPRSVVSESVMPSYPWLFRVEPKAGPGQSAVPIPPGFRPQSGVVVPTRKGRDLVDYLLSLKQVSLTRTHGQ
jgi:cytochrome c oxidase cbb3-type subunit 2